MRSHRIPSHRLAVAALCALASLALAGCSKSPTAPAAADTQQPSAPSGGSDILWGDPAPTETAPVTTTATTTTAPDAQASKYLYPLLGGSVSAGQFKVVVPAGALRQPARITVTQPRLDQRQVELSIDPPSANGFLVPVLLVANCSDMSLQLLSVQTIWWWNPTLQRWEAVLNVQVNLLGKTITAPLWHFSTYKVGGKAGW